MAKGGATQAPATAASAAGYSDSWAIVIGIDDYAKWPKLQYAVRDAKSVRETLIGKFGFAAGIVALENGEATRAGILAAFNDKLTHAGMKKNDRLFVFFAGHSATRQLSSGRDLGYIVPVDSDPNQLASDAIPMTELQNIAESVTAKHALFIMGCLLQRPRPDAWREQRQLPARQRKTHRPTDAHGRRRRPARSRRQLQRSLRLHLGAATGPCRQGRPERRRTHHRHRTRGLRGASRRCGVAPDTGFRQPSGSEGGDFIFEIPTETEFLSADTQQLPSEVIALNSKLDATRPVQPAPANSDKPAAPPTPAPVVVKDLQATNRKITPPVAVPAASDNSHRCCR